MKAFRATGNTAVKYTRYPLGQTPPNYILGHAAFELAFSEEALWPWLEAQRLPSMLERSATTLLGRSTATIASATAAAWLVACGLGGARVSRLAWLVSTTALVVPNEDG